MSLFIRQNRLLYNREYYRHHITRHKQMVKNYYQENREKILDKNKSKRYKCICGKEMNYYQRLSHFDSNYHTKRVRLRLFWRKWRKKCF